MDLDARMADLDAGMADIDARVRALDAITFGETEHGNIPADEYFAAREAGGEVGQLAYEEQATRQRATEEDWNRLLAEQLAKKQAETRPSARAARTRQSPLADQLLALRSNMAQAAQTVYDEWEQDEEGYDPEFGGGGICDRISEAISGVAVKIPGIDLTDGGQEGDDHAWTIVYNDKEAFGVDISPHIYEEGGGYNWTKRPGVTFTTDDVDVFPIDRSALGEDPSAYGATLPTSPTIIMAEQTEAALQARLAQDWPLAQPESWAPGPKGAFITSNGDMYAGEHGPSHDMLAAKLLHVPYDVTSFESHVRTLGQMTGWIQVTVYKSHLRDWGTMLGITLFTKPTASQLRAIRRLTESQPLNEIFISYDIPDSYYKKNGGQMPTYQELVAWLRGQKLLPETMGDIADQPTVAPAISGPPPNAPTTASEMIAELDGANFVDLGTVETMLGDRPEYLDAVASFIMEQREKLRAGMLMPRDVAKAYVITIGSQRAAAIDPNILTQKSGFVVPERFITINQFGTRVVRPEDAIGAWLLTPEGQHALDSVDQCQLDFASWNLLAWIRQTWGIDQYLRLNVFGGRGPLRTGSPAKDASWYNMTNICVLTDALNECHGDSVCLDGVIGRVSGVGAGKLGFMKHLIGLGDTPTVDAVETNFWLTGQADVRQLNDEDGRLVRSTAYWEHDRTVRAYLLGRFRQLFESMRVAGIGADLDPDVYAHIVHHWLWDKAKGARTEHVGMYEGQMFGATLADNPELTGLVTDALASEYQAIEMYDNIVGKAGLGDNETRLVAESIMVDEQEHADKLDTLLHQPISPEHPELGQTLQPVAEECGPEALADARWPDPEWEAATRATVDDWHTAIAATLVPIATVDIPERLEDKSHLPLLVTQDGQAWRGKSLFDIHDTMAADILRHLADSHDSDRVGYVATHGHLMRLDIEDSGLGMELWEAPTASQLRTALSIWSLAPLGDLSLTVELHLLGKPAVNTNTDRRGDLFSFLRYYSWMPAMAAAECDLAPLAIASAAVPDVTPLAPEAYEAALGRDWPQREPGPWMYERHPGRYDVFSAYLSPSGNFYFGPEGQGHQTTTLQLMYRLHHENVAQWRADDSILVHFMRLSHFVRVTIFLDTENFSTIGIDIIHPLTATQYRRLRTLVEEDLRNVHTINLSHLPEGLGEESAWVSDWPRVIRTLRTWGLLPTTLAAAECEEIPFAIDAPVGTSGDLAEWVSGITGSPAIVVDAEEAGRYPCLRVQLRPGHNLVYQKGIIGPLDESQQALYCQQGYADREPTAKQRERMSAMSDAAKLCKVESTGGTTQEHLVRYFACLGRELKAKGVNL